jgi:nickel/cobalt transporter (NicO) family protein
MPDITEIVRLGTSAWLYLPFAVVLGALHALEPGHAKSLMAAYIVSIRGNAKQATLLGLSAAVGHTIVVWVLAILGLALGNKLIVEQAEPWLWFISGLLIILLAARILWSMYRHGHSHSHDHSHDHQHGHDHDHEKTPHVRRPVQNSDIIWFGFTGGLLPCPSAIAVLLVCIQIKAFALGVAMVAAFSIGLAITLVGIGIGAAWGANKAVTRFPWFERVAERAPYFSAGLMLLLGGIMAISGISTIHAAGLLK